MRQFLSKENRLRKPQKKNNQTATQNSHQKITTTCSHNNRSLPHLGAILSQDQCYKKAGTEKETENRWRSKHQARYRLPRVQKRETKSADSNFAENPAYCSQNRSSESLLPQVLHTVACSTKERQCHRATQQRGFARRRGDRRRKSLDHHRTYLSPFGFSASLSRG